MCRVTFLRMRCVIFVVDCVGIFSKVTSAFFSSLWTLPSRQRCQVPPKPYCHLTARCYTRRLSLPAIKYADARACLNFKHLNIFLVKTSPFLVLNLLLKLITHNPDSAQSLSRCGFQVRRHLHFSPNQITIQGCSCVHFNDLLVQKQSGT